MKGFENNEMSVRTLKNLKNSLDNRIHEIYNQGYREGFNDGKNEAVNEIIGILADMWKADRKTEPTICDNCRYYNSNIPCGSTPSACKEADKFAEEFVNGLKDLHIIKADRKDEQTEREGSDDI